MDDPPGKVELDSDVITVPEAVTITVITKALFSERFSIGFGSGFRVLVGIGDIQEGDVGYQLTCRYCFATLHYDEHCQLITEDFHQGNRVLIAPRFGTVPLWGLTSPGSLSNFTCYSQNSRESIGISTIR